MAWVRCEYCNSVLDLISVKENDIGYFCSIGCKNLKEKERKERLNNYEQKNIKI